MTFSAIWSAAMTFLGIAVFVIVIWMIRKVALSHVEARFRALRAQR